MQYLLSNGAEIKLCKENIASPLYIARQNRHGITAHLLLGFGENVNLFKGKGRRVGPPSIAFQNGHGSTVHLFRSNGAIINLN